MAPEVQHHDLASIIRELERNAVEILGFDLGGCLADDEIPNLEEVLLSLLADGAVVGESDEAFEVGKLGDDSIQHLLRRHTDRSAA